MTGVGDIVYATRRTLKRSPTLRAFLTILDFLLEYAPAQVARRLRRAIFPSWYDADLISTAVPWVLQCRPDFRETIALMNSQEKSLTDPQSVIPADISTDSPRYWGILLPITSSRIDDIDAWDQLRTTLAHLVDSIPTSYHQYTRVHVGIDKHDPVFDNDHAREQIMSMLSPLLEVSFGRPLVPAYQGKLCWIWAKLAAEAVAAGADFFVLLGDDVEMHQRGWQRDVEHRFESISAERRLPFGFGCVAIRDTSFPGFPTFPVIHRLHLEIFDGKLFPKEFINQHGDPFLFEIYRRWGASRYTTHATLTNVIGGFEEARYRKANTHWTGNVLSKAIDRLDAWLVKVPGVGLAAKQVTCIDVVIPTFRCDVKKLNALCSLDCRQHASVQTTLVVDRPYAPNLDEVLSLVSYVPNRFVRVHVQEANAGASLARNTGLAQSFGDYAVLLDDDVVPQPGLLDAYISAVSRYPGEAVYVGLTELPRPKTWLQCALTACRICYFYGIAAITKNPPWGVTANLCVRSRTINRNFVFFKTKYPKTGGGEDIDFCIRSVAAGHGKIVAVPEAKVEHPFWDRPFKQVAGWAKGDVLCLEMLPQVAFYAAPNWAELALSCLLCALYLHFHKPGGPYETKFVLTMALMAPLIEIAMLFPRFFLLAEGLQRNRFIVALLAAAPPMLQDIVRLQSKVRRGRLVDICRHVDWMNKSGQHIAETRSNLSWKFMMWVLSGFVLQSEDDKFPMILFMCSYAFWLVRQSGKVLLAEWKWRRLVERPGLPIRFDSDKIPFVVLAYQRTGSNMLVRNYLNKHPDIHMHFELFNQKAIYTQSEPGSTTEGAIRNIASIRARDKDPAAFLETIVMASSSKAVGFKLFPEHVRDKDFLEGLLADRRIRKIILRRESELACITSIARATVTGEYIKASHDEIPVYITPKDFQSWTVCYEQYYAFLRDRLKGQQYTEITYESLVADADGTLEAVYELLGLKYRKTLKVDGDLMPQSFSALQDALVNYDELHSVFSSTARICDFD